MFKELYKGANDKIPTDDAKSRVMEKINRPNNVKKNYSYAKVAALAACFIITVGAVGIYENHIAQESIIYEEITPENLVRTVPNPVETQEPKQEVVAPQKETNTVKQEETKAPVTSVKRSRQYVPPKEITEPEISAPIVASIEIPQEPAASGNVITPNENFPEQASPMMVRYIEEEQTPVSVDDYYEYLGKDIESTVSLPDAFSNETPKEQNLTLDGEEVKDEWTFYFTDSENSVFVTTTKDTQKIQDFLNDPQYEKSTVAGKDVVVFEKGAEKDAYFISQDIGYTVKVHGVSDEDFENVLVSLTE